MSRSLEKITGYLLAVETLLNEKNLLTGKLEEKKIKWLENDQVFKERKVTLSMVLKMAMELLMDLSRHRATAHLHAL